VYRFAFQSSTESRETARAPIVRAASSSVASDVTTTREIAHQRTNDPGPVHEKHVLFPGSRASAVSSSSFLSRCIAQNLHEWSRATQSFFFRALARSSSRSLRPRCERL
jgi:hypothetical protein